MSDTPLDPLDAVRSQRDAIRQASRLITLTEKLPTIMDRTLLNHWRADQSALGFAEPYCWSDESTRAVLEASKTVPGETRVCLHHLAWPEPAWWYFPTPLPFKTTDDGAPVAGLLMHTFNAVIRSSPAATLALSMMGKVGGLRVSCWNAARDPSLYPPNSIGDLGLIAPSEVFFWEVGQSLDELIVDARRQHRVAYGPGGPLESKKNFGEDAFVEATAGIGRFIFAAYAWINQRIAVPAPLCLCNRERRAVAKANRVSAESVARVRVIHLRKSVVEGEGSPAVDENGARVYRVRWVVGGHWRLQPFGPGREQTRLVYIHPYLKGPDGAPLQEKATRVYALDR